MYDNIKCTEILKLNIKYSCISSTDKFIKMLKISNTKIL